MKGRRGIWKRRIGRQFKAAIRDYDDRLYKLTDIIREQDERIEWLQGQNDRLSDTIDIFKLLFPSCMALAKAVAYIKHIILYAVGRR